MRDGKDANREAAERAAARPATGAEKRWSSTEARPPAAPGAAIRPLARSQRQFAVKLSPESDFCCDKFLTLYQGMARIFLPGLESFNAGEGAAESGPVWSRGRMEGQVAGSSDETYVLGMTEDVQSGVGCRRRCSAAQ